MGIKCYNKVKLYKNGKVKPVVENGEICSGRIVVAYDKFWGIWKHVCCRCGTQMYLTDTQITKNLQAMLEDKRWYYED